VNVQPRAAASSPALRCRSVRQRSLSAPEPAQSLPRGSDADGARRRFQHRERQQTRVYVCDGSGAVIEDVAGATRTPDGSSR
jgi:hypothetical protein